MVGQRKYEQLPSCDSDDVKSSWREEHSDDSDGLLQRISSTQILTPKPSSRTAPESQSESQSDSLLFTWQEPWELSLLATVLFLVPALLGSIWFLLHITSRIWPATFFSLHLCIALTKARHHVLYQDNSVVSSRLKKGILSFPPALDIFLFGYTYRGVVEVFDYFFNDIDGTTVVEWLTQKHCMRVLQLLGLLTVLSRIMVGGLCILSRWSTDGGSSLPSLRLTPVLVLDRFQNWMNHSSWVAGLRQKQRRHRMQNIISVVTFGSLVWLSICVASCVSHYTSFHLWLPHYDHCDPLDTTECALPFPSFHHMVRDNSTVTGWRVNLRGEVLPLLRGGIRVHLDFLNDLDGFSTMAPILFYMEGLKEAYELHGSVIGLQGPAHIEYSVTNRSITLLVNVDSGALVPHSAEIDYLDPERPLVLVFPAQPLYHGTHYALAVVDATDVHGKRMHPTLGMKRLLKGDADDWEKLARYRDVVIPSLESAAPWVSHTDDPGSLQLLFDFVTVSEEAQLGPIRAVRNGALHHLQSRHWGDWGNHVDVIKIRNEDCSKNDTLAARTIYASLDVPWFLDAYGRGHRGATLSSEALKSGKPVTIGKAKFVVIVPCSVQANALNPLNGTPVRALLEYGHGLFYNRGEAYSHSLLRVAQDHGYIIMAMDWRGMSNYDFPIVMKTLLAQPRLFAATRDNLIQGYANKLALQHFSQNGLLNTEWLRFQDTELDKHSISQAIRTYDDEVPISVFYGSSQGGILGSGYSALLGPTGLIERGILGVPGTSFSLVMSRSSSFETYDALMTKNFYNNRHVRLVLTVMQMGWDPVEAAGMLAPPVEERYPRMLLQAGLGDATVPTIAAEALARAYGASTLPNNPRHIFGIPEAEPANGTWEGPYVTLTELLYEKEYASLPVDDVYAKPNNVHFCVRQDCALLGQMAEFINTGRVIDPCVNDRCLRTHIACHVSWSKNNTKPSNWTCPANTNSSHETFDP